MPYFVYRIPEERKLEYIDTFEKYREAREITRSQRAELGKGSTVLVKMIYAKNQTEAEKLLLAPREERYIDEG